MQIMTKSDYAEKKTEAENNVKRYQYEIDKLKVQLEELEAKKEYWKKIAYNNNDTEEIDISNYHLIDEPLCYLVPRFQCHADCRKCKYFFDCYEKNAEKG